MNSASSYKGTQTELLAHYNQWMNEKVYACARELSDADRKRDLGAFFKSIHSTLNHLLAVDTSWLARFLGQPVSLPPIGTDLFEGFEELAQARVAKDAELIQWAKTVTDYWLKQPYTFTSVLYQRTFTQPTFALVSQLFNHQTHHRGQVTTLLKQLGVDPGITDIPMMPILNE